MNRSDIPDDVLKKMTRPYGWLVFYNPVAQHGISVSNYWHDPNHYNQMIRSTTFLPQINGWYDVLDDTTSTSTNRTLAKTNFCLLEKAVFLGSHDDDCINPPTSAVFEFVTADDGGGGGDGRLIPLTESIEYINDTFGLRTMIQRRKLIVRAYSGLDHLSWRRPDVFQKYVLPHLVDDEVELVRQQEQQEQQQREQ
jgi:hypothetical protein